MQYQREFTSEFILTGEDIEEEAAYIVENITSFEEDTHQLIEKTFQNMPETFFRAFRRTAPITQTYMDWEKEYNAALGRLGIKKKKKY